MKNVTICGIIGSALLLILAVLPMSSFGLGGTVLLANLIEPIILLIFFITFYKRLKK